MVESRQNIASHGSILIIDDDPGLTALMAAALEEEGLNSCCAACGEQALEQIALNTPNLIILDYTLPDMTGAAFIERMRARELMIPFIMVTGRDDAKLAVQMMKTGACDYLLKDISFLDLLPAVVSRALQEDKTNKRLQHAEMSLRQSEMRLARAQKIARMGSWEWNIITNEIYWSDELYRIFGLTPGRPAKIDQDRKSVV